MYDIETTDMSFTMHNDACTTHVTTTGDHGDVTRFKMNEIGEFVLLNVELDCIVDVDGRIGVADGTTVVRGDVRYSTGTESNAANFEQFVRSLFRCNTVDGESALHVVKDSEVFARFLQGADVCIKSKSKRS